MIAAIVLAGGSGERFGSTIPKPFMSLNGKPVLQWAIDVIEPAVDEVVVVAPEPWRHYKWAPAGNSRTSSVRDGLTVTTADRILIHDGVRPFLTSRIVTEVIAALDKHPAVDTAVPVVDGLLIDGTPQPKAGVWLGQTPEGFHRQVLEEAFRLATGDWQDEVTMVWATLGIEPHVIRGVDLNTKLTYPKDLENAEGVMRFWHEPITAIPEITGTVLILGGTGGIGAAVASRLPDIVAPSRSDLDLSGPFTIDLTGIQAVVHAAGAYETEADIMPVNFDSIRRLVDQARTQNWTGNIVVVSSTAATYGRRGIGLYSASKAALNTWIEAVHDELTDDGIRINAVAPAKVATRLQRSINPDADPAGMLSPGQVADRILPYLDTEVHGQIVYLRVGLTERQTDVR